MENAILRLGQGFLLAAVIVLPWLYGGVYMSQRAWLTLVMLAPLGCTGLLWRSLTPAWSRLIFPLLILAAGCLLGGWQLTTSAAKANPKAAEFRAEFAVNAEEPAPEAPLSLHPPATRRDLALLIVAASSFALGAVFFASVNPLLALMGVLTAGGFAVSVLGLLQRISGQVWSYGGAIAPIGSQPFGPFISRNNAGGFLCLCLAAAMGILLWRVRRVLSRRYTHRHDNRTSLATLVADTRILLAATAVITISAGIIGTLSRGSMLAAALGAITAATLLGFATRSAAYFWPIVCGAALSLAFAVWLGQGELAAARWNQAIESGGASESRPNLWRECWEATRIYSWFGSGLGTFYYAHAPFQRHRTFGMYLYGENQYVEAAVVGGWLGLTLLLLLGVYGLNAVQKLIRNAVGSGEYGIAFGTAALLSMQAIYGAFDFGWYLPAIFVPLAIWCGGACRLAMEGPSRKLRRRVTPSFVVLPSHTADKDTVELGGVDSPAANESTAPPIEMRESTTVDSPPSKTRPRFSPAAKCFSWAVYICLAIGLAGAYRETCRAALIEQAERSSRRFFDPAAKTTVQDAETAIALQRIAVEACLDDGEARLRLAELLAKRFELETGLTTSQVYTAAALCERIQNRPQLEELRRNPAVVAYLMPALDECRKAGLLCPLNYFAHLLAAQLSFLHAPPDFSDQHLARAERLAQGRSDWLYYLGKLQLDAANLDAAWSDWRQACALQPSLTDSVFPVVLEFLSPQDALKRVVPDDPETIVRLARNFLNTPHHAAARKEYFRQALGSLSAVSNTTPAFQFLRGFCFAELGRLEDAETDVSEALRGEIAEADWYFELAAIRAALGKRQAADVAYARYELLLGSAALPLKTCLASAAKLLRQRQPLDAESGKRCGELYLEIGEPNEARRVFSETIRESPNDAEAYGGLAASHLRIGDAEKAVEAATRAVSLNPTNDAWRRLLELAQEAVRKNSQDSSSTR